MKYSTFLNPLAALLIDWMTELSPSRMALVAFLENQFRMPSRSYLTVPATTFISGTLECMIQETTRSSSLPADSLSGRA